MRADSLQLLLVDNDSEKTHVLQGFLEQIDQWQGKFKRIEWSDSVLDHLENNSVDVVFLSFSSRNTQERVDLAHQIRSRNPHLPMIAISSHGSEQLVANTIRAGSDDYRNFDELSPESLRDSIQYSLQLRENHRNLKRAAKYDDLTHLYNRKFIMNILGNEMKDAVRHNRQLFICLFDLDGFKEINDSHGHIVGNDILEEVGDIISGSLRGGDSAGRFGGDEFLILLADTDSDGAETTVKRLLRNIKTNPYKVRGSKQGEGEISLSASVGLTEFDGRSFERYESVGDLRGIIDQADKALYQAKSDGGDGLDRRRYERVSVQQFPIQISYGSYKHDAELIDYSEEGLRIRFQPMGDFRDKITIHFETENNHRIERTGHVKWTKEEPRIHQVMVGINVRVPTEELIAAPQARESVKILSENGDVDQ